MKLKKLLKQGKKQTKKQEPKPEVQQKTKVDDQEEQRDEALIDIKEDLKKKQQPKPKVAKRVDTNKLEQTEIDTSKLIIEKKQETKKPITSWVVEQQNVKDLLQEDFKLTEREHEFESLTDTKLNEQLKQKKQKIKEEQKAETIGQMKFAPLQGGDVLESKTTDKLVLGKPKIDTQPIGFSTTPALNFTNTKLGANINVAPLQKPTVTLYDDDIERKARQRLEETKKAQQEANKGKGAWFKKGPATTEAPKQAPKIEFKSSPLTFTNSALKGQNQQQQFKGFQPIEKSKQQQIYERKQQQFIYVSKKETEERRKKREEEEKLKQQPTNVSAQQKA